MSLVLTPLAGIPEINPGDDLGANIVRSVTKNEIDIQDSDIFVLAQKIVSKSEDRIVDLKLITPSNEARELADKTEKDPRLVELILQESRNILRIKPGTIIVEHNLGFICANAGIDRSNIFPGSTQNNENVLLLPKNPDRSAERIREQLQAQFAVRIGVVIIDSHGRAWRIGTAGTVIGLSGVPGIIDLRGTPDLAGRPLQNTLIGAADELAAGASLVMGQASESTPVVHVRGFPYELRESNLDEILRPPREDLFR